MLRSSIGYLWAFPNTLLGLALVPLAWLPGGRAQVVEGVLEVWGPPIDGFLRRTTRLAGGAAALTLGHVVLARDDRARTLTRRHERVHVAQCTRWGPFFLPAYGIASLLCLLRGGHVYLDNPFEREARRLAGEAPWADPARPRT